MRRILRASGAAALALVLAVPFAMPAHAHAFGRRYDLPIPLWLYLAGAGTAVALSFVAIAIFIRATPSGQGYPRLNLLRWRLFRMIAHPCSLLACRLISVALFVCVLSAGLYGMPVPQYNLAPTFVWIIWWVGLAYVSALVGDLWALTNPWKIIFGWAERLFAWFRSGAKLSLRVPYPSWLGVYPAVLLFLSFAWMEHAYPGNADPRNIATAALVYSAITWAGMLLFGAEAWLKGGEIFSVVFSLLARFAPTEVRVRNPDACASCSALDCRSSRGEHKSCYTCFGRAGPTEREWNLRPYAAGLAADEPVHASMMCFVMLLLSTLALDGFFETPAAVSLFDALVAAEPLPPLATALEATAGGMAAAFVTLALVIAPVLFLGIYCGFAWLMTLMVAPDRPQRDQVGQSASSVWDVARLFTLSLVPIAIAYHLAHYLSFLLIHGQGIIPLASDPFGFDWDLLGTASHRIDIGIVGARFTWYTAVIAIVAGHVISVYLAHIVAVRTFKDRRRAVRSQYPMLVLMVGYTTLSLWILAQPVVDV